MSKHKIVEDLYGPAAEDVLDEGGRGLVRARYLGTDEGPHAWLVYGDDMDTCGVITRSQIATAGTPYVAHSHGKERGRKKTIRAAVELVLSPGEIRTFRGER